MARARSARTPKQPDRITRRRVRQRRFVRLVGYWTCLIALGLVIGFVVRTWREPSASIPPPITQTSQPGHVKPTIVLTPGSTPRP